MATFEEIKKLIIDLGNRLEPKIDTITERVEEVNANITRELRALEEKHDTDVQKLRDDFNDLGSAVAENHRHALEEFKSLKDTAENRYSEATLRLNAAEKIIDKQKNRIRNLERSSHAGLQHRRGWNVEVDGIPSNVGDEPDQLQDAFLKIINAINVRATATDIDTIHRLPSRNRESKPTIVALHSRKLVRLIHDNKNKLKDLKDLNIDIPGLHDESRIYIRASQCQYYKNLAYNCRMLKRSELIDSYYTAKDGRISIKSVEGENIKISHESDLLDQFPDFNFSFNNGEYGMR